MKTVIVDGNVGIDLGGNVFVFFGPATDRTGMWREVHDLVNDIHAADWFLKEHPHMNEVSFRHQWIRVGGPYGQRHMGSVVVTNRLIEGNVCLVSWSTSANGWHISEQGQSDIFYPDLLYAVYKEAWDIHMEGRRKAGVTE